MQYHQIIELQKRIGTTPDGFFGEKSVAKCKEYLRSLMPKDHPWPTQDQASLTKFYGRPGDETQLVNLAVNDLDIRYDGKNVKSIRCHRRNRPHQSSRQQMSADSARDAAHGIVGSVVPVLGLVTSLQEQVEWGMRVTSLGIGIIVGLISAWQLLKKR